MTKKKGPVTHRMGKRTGYDVGEGCFYPAATYQGRFEDYIAEWQGVDALLQAVIAYCDKRFSSLRAQQRAIWDDLRADYGEPFAGQWSYNAVLRCIEPVAIEPVAVECAPEPPQ